MNNITQERLFNLLLLADSCTLEQRKEVIEIARNTFSDECIDKLIDACEKAFEVSE